ncbi:MAG: type II secretion system F family protein [Bdellovibrionota bacterium]
MELNADTTLPLVISALFGLGAATFAVFLQDEPSLADGGIQAGNTRRTVEQKSLFLRIFGGAIRALGKVIATLPLGESREKLRKKLLQAGNPGGLTVDEFHASRLIGVVLAVIAGMFVDSSLDVSPMFTVVLGFLGFLYPNIYLNGMIQKRRRRIFRDLPDILDILRLATDAGLDMNSAMKVVVEKGRPGPMLYELEQVEREVSLGRTRREAFRNFADRISMTEINSFVLALLQAEQLGASVGPVLRAQSEMARTRRWQVAEVLVNKMPMKMLGPLVVFIFPSSFIILFTPLLIQWFQSK